MPKVSLIIPTFNRPHFLLRAVESAQKAGRDVEVIVVDDASIDATAKVCANLSGIKYVRLDRNQGVAGARNVGLLESTSEFIAFLDDDDLRVPGSLDHQVALLESDCRAGFVAGAVTLVDENYVPTGEVGVPHGDSGDIFWDVLALRVHLIPGSVVVRKECFHEVGLFNQRLAGIDDWDLFTRIAHVHPVLLDETPVCIYRLATPSSQQGSSELSKHLYSAVKHQENLFSLPRARAANAERRRRIRRDTKRRVADTLSWRAAEALPQGAYRFAASNFLFALRLSPLFAARPTHFGVLCRSAAAKFRTKTGSQTSTTPTL